MPKCSSHRGGGGQSWGARVRQGLLTQEEAKEVEYFFSLIDKCVEFCVCAAVLQAPPV